MNKLATFYIPFPGTPDTLDPAWPSKNGMGWGKTNYEFDLHFDGITYILKNVYGPEVIAFVSFPNFNVVSWSVLNMMKK